MIVIEHNVLGHVEATTSLTQSTVVHYVFDIVYFG